MSELKADDVERRKVAWDDIYIYRIISLFSTFCVGLCMFGMDYGFVNNSKANKGLWAVLSLIFFLSQSLLHFVDKTTRNQLSKLPLHLLHATQPMILLRLYYIGLLIDIITLMLTLIASYFFTFSHPLVTSVCFVLLLISWYNTNEVKLYFIKALEDVPLCSDTECAAFNKSYNELMISSIPKDVIHSKNREHHYHYNPEQHILTSLDGIKASTSLYIIVYFIWFILFIYHCFTNESKTIYILSLITLIQFIRICFQVSSLFKQRQQGTQPTHDSTSSICIGMRILSPFAMRILLFMNGIMCCLMFIYGTHDDDDSDTTWIMFGYALNILLGIIIILSMFIVCDEYFRIECLIVSLIIILQVISLSPNVLSSPYRQVMLISSFLNLFALFRITCSSSLLICLRLSHNIVNHLAFPRLFLTSYILGVLVTNISGIYMILKIYSIHSNHYETEDPSNYTETSGSGSNNSISLNCSYYECFNLMIMMATWWPMSVQLNNENARFIDRYRIINDVPFNTNDNIQYRFNDNKRIQKIDYPYINSVDGSRPLIPILFVLLLMSMEIGLIQADNCVTNSTLFISCLIIFVVASRVILLIISM